MYVARRLMSAVVTCAVVPGLVTACAPSAGRPVDRASDATVEHGRYVVMIAGCNHCHTAEYIEENNGAVSEQEWLKGNALSWRGPWSTTYPSNLRLYINATTEDQWVAVARARRSRQPMPWFNVNAMTTFRLIDPDDATGEY